MRRGCIKQVLNILRRLLTSPKTRGLEAAGGGRRWKDTSPSVNSSTIHGGAAVVAQRAQAFVLNNPLASRTVESLVSNIIGDGIKPRCRHRSEMLKNSVQANFFPWTDEADAERRCDFFGMQATLVRDMIVFGEGLALLENDPQTGAPSIRRLHPEQLARELTRRLPNGGTIYQGVEFDANGRIRAYHIRSFAPGDTLALIAQPPVRHIADDVIHMFRQLVPGQVRGLSWFAQVLLPAKELDALMDAMLVRAKVAALHSGFIYDNDGAPIYDGEQNGALLDASLEPGAILTLPTGKSIEFGDVPDQGGATALLTVTMRMIAAGMGITYEAATGDYSQVNYSSARASMLELRRFITGIQHHVVVFQLCRPIWKRFIRYQVLIGTIPATAYAADRAIFDTAKWLPPAWREVDAQKSAKAAEIDLKNNLRSRSEIVAERGYDVEDVDVEIAADADRLNRMGFSSPKAENAERSISPVTTMQAPAPIVRAAFRPSTINQDERTVELVASAGADVPRNDFEGPFVERLIVSKEAIDLTRIDGMPLLDTHRQDGLERVLGVVRNARIEAGKLIVSVQISRRHDAIWRDIEDGIVGSTSIGYLPLKWRDQTDARTGVRIRSVTRWELREVSLVPIAADPDGKVREQQQGIPA